MKTLCGVLGVILLAGALRVPAGAAEEYGMIMGIAGEGAIVRGGQRVSAAFGETLYPEDVIQVAAYGEVTLSRYLKCEEFTVKGPAAVRLLAGGYPHVKDLPVNPNRKLPVCYTLTEFQDGVNRIAGVIARGDDPVDPHEKDLFPDLRADADAGTASAASLAALAMHDLVKGRGQRAQTYVNLLESRMPGNPLIRSLREACLRLAKKP